MTISWTYVFYIMYEYLIYVCRFFLYVPVYTEKTTADFRNRHVIDSTQEQLNIQDKNTGTIKNVWNLCIL